MFISCVLKIPSEARFPVWKVHFQKEIQDFSSVRVSLQNRTENVFRHVFQRACLRLQRQKQRYKSYVKCAYAHTYIFVLIYVYTIINLYAWGQHYSRISIYTCETNHITKQPRHTQPLDYLRTVTKKHGIPNYFSFTSIVL